MILLQEVIIHWTKRERGAIEGKKRNAIPTSCALPPIDPDEAPTQSPLSDGLFWHNFFHANEEEPYWSRARWIKPEAFRPVVSRFDPWAYTNLKADQLDGAAASRGEYEFDRPKDRYGFEISRHVDHPLTFKLHEETLSVEFAWDRWQHYYPVRRGIQTFKLAQGETGRFEINGRNDSTAGGMGRQRTYQKTTYNIHFTDQFEPDIFLTRPFDHLIDMKIILY